MGKPAYPAILTNATWQAEKGKIAKLVGKETGVGAALTLCQQAYDKLNPQTLGPKQAYATAAEIDKGYLAAMAEGKKFEPVRALLFKARDAANKAAETYQKSKLIPASSTAYATAVGKACESFALVCKSYDVVVTQEFARAKEKLANTLKVMADALRSAIPKVKTGIAEVKKDPTPGGYNTKCWQAVRGLAANVAKSSFLSAYQPEAKVLSSLTPEKLKDKPTILAHLTKLEQFIVKIEPAIPK